MPDVRAGLRAESPTLLLCGNGMSGEAVPKLKQLGYAVYVITEFPHDCGLDAADGVLEAGTKRPAEALEAALRLNAGGVRFDGVMSLCWDCAESVAMIAAHFGLRSVTPETAQRATNKALRSEAFRNAGVPAPRFAVVLSFAECKAAVEEIKLPVVLKPVALSSAKGVVRVDSLSQLQEAYQYTSGFAPGEPVVVNEYLRGTEHSTEGVMIGGRLHLTAISDRIFDYERHSPHFVEVGDVMPSVVADDVAEAMRHATQEAALAVGIIDGVAKGDLLVAPDGGVWVFEIAARLGGPRFGTEMVPLSNGTDILRAAAQQALGQTIDLDALKPRWRRGMVNRSIFPKPGTVTEIRGLDTVRSMPGYYDFKWFSPRPLQIGDVIPPYENTGGVGYFIATGRDRAEALQNADRIERGIQIMTE